MLRRCKQFFRGLRQDWASTLIFTVALLFLVYLLFFHPNAIMPNFLERAWHWLTQREFADWLLFGTMTTTMYLAYLGHLGERRNERQDTGPVVDVLPITIPIEITPHRFPEHISRIKQLAFEANFYLTTPPGWTLLRVQIESEGFSIVDDASKEGAEAREAFRKNQPYYSFAQNSQIQYGRNWYPDIAIDPKVSGASLKKLFYIFNNTYFAGGSKRFDLLFTLQSRGSPPRKVDLRAVVDFSHT